MNTPTITEIRAAWSIGDKATRATLESLYGTDIVTSITDRVKLPKDAFTTLGIDYNDPHASGCPDNLHKGIVAFHRLQVIAAALNEGWTPDWEDEDQDKYYPWFVFRSGRFVFGDVSYYYSFSDLGSRLCFRTRELAEYAGRQFEDLYKDFFTL